MLELFRAIFAPPRDLVLLIAAGWAGLALADKWAKRSPVGEKAIDTLVGGMTLAFLIGGRLLYAAEHFAAFAGSPSSLVSLNMGLFDLWGGAAAALLLAAVIIQRRGLPAWQTLDLLTPFFASLSIGLALSHLATGAAFGKPADVPWAVNLWGAQRHPTQVYELLAGIVVLAIVWRYMARAALPGNTFLLWAALTAGSRLVIEGFRGDSTLILGGLRLAQIIAWVALAAALLCMELLNKREAGQAASVPEEPAAAQPLPLASATNKKRRAAPRKNIAP